MNRIFLALLALFAGLATQVSPAEARVRGDTEIGSVLGQRTAARTTAAVQAPAAFRTAVRFAQPQTVIEPVPAFTAPVVLTVHLGPDRARE